LPNIGSVPDNILSQQIKIIIQKRDSGLSASTSAALEPRLQQEKSERRIERFFWILAVTILGDCILMKFMDSVFSSLFIILLSLVLLIGMAQWLQVPWIVRHLEALLARYSGKAAAADETE
jgi:hypothetical protein